MLLRQPSCELRLWTAVVRRIGAGAGRSAGARLGELYRAIHAESGAKLIVDVAHDLHALDEAVDAEGADLRLLHLRRQGLAVLNSRMRRSGWQRNGGGPLPRFRRAFRHVARWRAYERAADKLRRDMGEERAIAIRYEMLCSEPMAALAAIGRLTGMDFTAIGNSLPGKPLKPMPHMIRGNPRLKAKETVDLAADEGFRRELTLSDRFAYIAASAVASATRKARAIGP